MKIWNLMRIVAYAFCGLTVSCAFAKGASIQNGGNPLSFAAEQNPPPSHLQSKNTQMINRQSKQGKETVVLLHGIGHSKMNMALMSLYLKSAGFDTVNISYPSRQNEIKTLASWLDAELTRRELWQKNHKVHFVAHSMGGLVSGFYLDEFKDKIPRDKVGRVVMLGTPHGGSEVADGIKNWWLFKAYFGPAGQELTTNARQNDKIDPYYELGIIAGNRNWLYPLGAKYIKGAHDGCVSVESTKVQGMKDHITIPVLHGDMGWDLRVRKQVIHFLKNGVFSHAS